MSRFFATGSDSESDTSSEEEQVIRQPTANFTVSTFLISITVWYLTRISIFKLYESINELLITLVYEYFIYYNQ